MPETVTDLPGAVQTTWDRGTGRHLNLKSHTKPPKPDSLNKGAKPRTLSHRGYRDQPSPCRALCSQPHLQVVFSVHCQPVAEHVSGNHHVGFHSIHGEPVHAEELGQKGVPMALHYELQGSRKGRAEKDSTVTQHSPLVEHKLSKKLIGKLPVPAI